MRKNKKKQQNILPLIIVIVLILILIFIPVFLSSNKDKKIFTFSTSEFKHITAIGVNEFVATMDDSHKSIIFICNNENKDCYDMLTILDSIADERSIYVEYINVLELTDEEREYMQGNYEYLKDSLYPKLLLINNKRVATNDAFLTKEEIVEELDSFIKE